jgi:hypothetical protein
MNLRMSGSPPEHPTMRGYREMTVALIRDRKEADAVEVAFSESARYYRLPRRNPEFPRILQQLRKARETSQPVRVLADFPDGEDIEDVQAGTT